MKDTYVVENIFKSDLEELRVIITKKVEVLINKEINDLKVEKH